MELWKDINNASNYEVSNYGQVRNKTTKYILKWRVCKTGYYQVSIKLDDTGKFQNQYIHRLVAMAWLPNEDNKPSVNHKDGDKSNNRVDNLEWMTYAEQQTHRAEVLGKKNIGSPKKVGQYSKDGKLIQIFESVEEAAASFGKARTNIDNAIHHKKNQQTAYGYIWKYIE